MWLQILFLVYLIGATTYFLIELKKTIVKLYVVLQGPFFAPTSYKRIKQIARLAKLKPNMKLADLGAGDGRVLIELAKSCPGIKAVGIELDPEYVKLARKNISAAGLAKKIQIKHASFWEVSLSEYDVITTYCIQRFMGKLEKKLKNEIKKSCKVISVFFQFPTWEPKKQLGDIRLYRK
ncbi:methyltransferase domain-containing protein [Patescibacteria group bacterium]|nr:methyltransferase domain-containing protein [Patescibacteria group bacterium]MBU1967309.1 methyltransferase domain-containing protein [Patescibacteria group bacterium]MBU2543454.1 methyltransferase domain-containing protein [Patescibacteria group bacterium]